MEQKVFTFHFILKDELGYIIDSSYGGSPIELYEGANQIFPELEKAICTSVKGQKTQFVLHSDFAYSDTNPCHPLAGKDLHYQIEILDVRKEKALLFQPELELVPLLH